MRSFFRLLAFVALSAACYGQHTQIQFSKTIPDIFGNPFSGRINFILNASGTWNNSIAFSAGAGVDSVVVTSGVFPAGHQVLDLAYITPGGNSYSVIFYNGAGTVELTLPNVLISGPVWDGSAYAVPAKSTINGLGKPLINCQAGAFYRQNDAPASQNMWTCIAVNGGNQWYLNPPQINGVGGSGGYISYFPFATAGVINGSITETAADTFKFGNGGVGDASASIYAGTYYGDGSHLTGITSGSSSCGSDYYIDVTCSPYLASVTASDNTAALQAAFNAAASTHLGRVLIPAGTFKHSSPLDIPNKVRVFGVGRGDSGGMNTVLQASSSFPGSATFPGNMMERMGYSGPGNFGSSMSDLSVDCNGVAGCGGLYAGDGAQEESWFQRINVTNYTSYGLWVTYAQNSGPYDQLEFLSESHGTTSTVCAVFNGTANMRGLTNGTCNAAGYASKPTRGIWISGPNGSIRNFHIENVAEGVTVGNPTSTHAEFNYDYADGLKIENVDCTQGCSNTAHVIVPTWGVQSRNYTFQNLQGPIQDDSTAATTHTIASTPLYICNGYPNTSAGCLSFDQSSPWNLYMPVNIQSTLTVQYGARMYWDNPPGTHLMSLYYDNNNNINVLKNQIGGAGTGGLLIQDQASSSGRAGGGTYVWGNGYTHSGSWGGMMVGALTDGATYTALATNAAGWDTKDGVINFYSRSDSTLTPGSGASLYNPLQLNNGDLFAPQISGGLPSTGLRGVCITPAGKLQTSTSACTN